MAGQIDEQGYMNGMNKKGFNSSRVLSELYANSIDAGATKIVAKIDRDYIYIIDDGFEWIFQVMKIVSPKKKIILETDPRGFPDSVQNHLLKYFQRIQQMLLFKKNNGNYYKSVAPWNIMVRKDGIPV